MTTASTNTVLNHSTDAGFVNWVNELMTALITTLGLTQTADSGQQAFPLVGSTRPGTNTALGYYILRFNDTLQSTTPIFIKVEVGTGSVTTMPGLWITVGTGSSGGTLSGASTRVACSYGAAPASTVTNYVGHACYNATQGVLWIDWKQNAPVTNSSAFNFMIFRSVDNTGAPTGNAVHFMSCSTAATVSTNSGMPIQLYNAASAAWTGPAASGSSAPTNWCFVPFSAANTAASTLAGTAGQVFPCFQSAATASVPALGITNVHAMANQGEIAYGATVALTILGSLSLTYIGSMCGSTTVGAASLGITSTAFSHLRLWQ